MLKFVIWDQNMGGVLDPYSGDKNLQQVRIIALFWGFNNNFFLYFLNNIFPITIGVPGSGVQLMDPDSLLRLMRNCLTII